MRRTAFAVALAFASPAAAVPPAPPLPGALAVAQAYIRSMRANDARAYEALFATNAQVVVEDEAAPPSKAGWRRVLILDFSSPYRTVQFLRIFETPASDGGKLVAKFEFLEKLTDNNPGRAEHFPIFRLDTISVQSGHIIRLQRSASYLTELSGDGTRADYGG